MNENGRSAIFVSITEGLNGGVEDIKQETPLVDKARGWWAVTERVDSCELLVAVNAGVVVGVWEIDRGFGWKPMAVGAIPTRPITQADVETPHGRNCKYCQVTQAIPPERVHIGSPLSEVSDLKQMYGPIQYGHLSDEMSITAEEFFGV